MTVSITTTERINGLHKEIENALHQSLNNAIEIGQLLTDAKKALPHGQFTSWIETNCIFTDRTARRYMKLHKERDKLKNAAGIQEAYQLLREPKTDTVSELEPQDLAGLEAVISESKETVEQVLTHTDKIAQILKGKYPAFHLPAKNERLTVSSFHTLDSFIDEQGGFCLMTVERWKNWKKQPGFYNVIIRKISLNHEYGYEIYNPRGGVRLSGISDLILFYSKDFAFSKVAHVEMA